jgi:nucleoside-diphosphate-sugar epimerase
MDPKRIIIVGGSGFVGQNLTKVLSEKGFSILILDFSPCPSHVTNLPSVYFNKIDLMDVEELEQRVSSFKPLLVIHLASWGMSGEGMLSELCQKINVQGTANLLDICFKHNVSKFIYTSSYNVVFGGKEIRNGNESDPYFDESEQVDQYSSSKTRAEKLVMQANGKLTKNDSQFMSASIRPCAIYGEGVLNTFLQCIPSFIRHRRRAPPSAPHRETHGQRIVLDAHRHRHCGLGPHRQLGECINTSQLSCCR